MHVYVVKFHVLTHVAGTYTINGVRVRKQMKPVYYATINETPFLLKRIDNKYDYLHEEHNVERYKTILKCLNNTRCTFLDETITIHV